MSYGLNSIQEVDRNVELNKIQDGEEKHDFICAMIVFQALFTLDQCIGIIGGRPKHSLYFVGFQGN